MNAIDSIYHYDPQTLAFVLDASSVGVGAVISTHYPMVQSE